MIVLFVVVCVSPSTKAQRAFPKDTQYVGLGLYEYAQVDTLQIHTITAWIVGEPLDKRGVVFEWYRPMITILLSESRPGKPRFASTPFVMGCLIGLEGIGMTIAGVRDSVIDKVTLYSMMPFGAHLAYRPSRWLTFYAGVVPDFIMFTGWNGVLLSPRAGFRIDPGKTGLTFSAGVQKTHYRGFTKPNQDLPLGFYVRLGYFSPFGSALLD